MLDLYDVWFTLAIGTGCSNREVIAHSKMSPKDIYENRKNLSSEFFTKKQIEKAAKTDMDIAYEPYNIYLKSSVNSINYTDELFPRRFEEIENRPLILYYKGDRGLLNPAHTVGIVGSRRCSGDGEQSCIEISGNLAENGVVIVSGLAQGIDYLAHKAATDNGKKTVAFIGTDLTSYFPKQHREYQDYLCQTNLVITEYVPGSRYYDTNFINRNRLIAGMSDALCVIQATNRSGSLSTVNRALKYGRPVFAVPGGVYSESYAGSNGLLYDCKAFATKDGANILPHLGIVPGEKKSRAKADIDENRLFGDALAVYKAIDGAVFPNRIIRQTGLPAAAVNRVLTELEIDDYIKKTTTGEYIKNK